MLNMLFAIGGLSLLYVGLTAEEFFEGGEVPSRPPVPLPRWQGRLVFCLVGTLMVAAALAGAWFGWAPRWE